MPTFGIIHYPSFVAAILLFQAVPGPGTVAILRATARGGFAAGMRAVIGTVAGDFVHMSAAALGLAAALAGSPNVFAALQWLGIAYLIGMGLRMLRAPGAGNAAADEPAGPGLRDARQAFAVALTNPKVAVFFMAFFPQFMPETTSRATLAAMMLHVSGLSLAYQTGLVLLGGALARRLSSVPSARRIASRLAGVALVGFGLKLAIDRRF